VKAAPRKEKEQPIAESQKRLRYFPKYRDKEKLNGDFPAVLEPVECRIVACGQDVTERPISKDVIDSSLEFVPEIITERQLPCWISAFSNKGKIE
jgi:hypothetical protein